MTTPDEQAISRERYEAVVAERDQYKSEVGVLGGKVQELGLEKTAREYFEGKQVTDATHWASIAVPHLANVDVDNIPSVLDQKFGNLPTAGQEPATAEPSQEPPAPAEPPRPTVSGQPNPAASGEPPSTQKKLSTSDPEFKAIFAREGYDGMRRLIAEGRLEFQSGNQYGRQLTGS